MRLSQTFVWPPNRPLTLCICLRPPVTSPPPPAMVLSRVVAYCNYSVAIIGVIIFSAFIIVFAVIVVCVDCVVIIFIIISISGVVIIFIIISIVGVIYLILQTSIMMTVRKDVRKKKMSFVVIEYFTGIIIGTVAIILTSFFLFILPSFSSSYIPIRPFFQRTFHLHVNDLAWPPAHPPPRPTRQTKTFLVHIFLHLLPPLPVIKWDREESQSDEAGQAIMALKLPRHKSHIQTTREIQLVQEVIHSLSLGSRVLCVW